MNEPMSSSKTNHTKLHWAADCGVFTSLQCHSAANWAQNKHSLMKNKPKRCDVSA